MRKRQTPPLIEQLSDKPGGVDLLLWVLEQGDEAASAEREAATRRGDTDTEVAAAEARRRREQQIERELDSWGRAILQAFEGHRHQLARRAVFDGVPQPLRELAFHALAGGQSRPGRPRVLSDTEKVSIFLTYCMIGPRRGRKPRVMVRGRLLDRQQAIGEIARRYGVSEEVVRRALLAKKTRDKV